MNTRLCPAINLGARPSRLRVRAASRGSEEHGAGRPVNSQARTPAPPPPSRFKDAKCKTFVRSLLILFIALHCVALRAADAPALQTDFRVTSAFPKYLTADLEFRDPTGAKWPNFFYGKPANDAGHLRLGAQPAASFTLLCDRMAQEKGDQSRKVLGELYAPDKPPVVTLTIIAMGAIQPAADARDKSAQSAELTGALEVGGRKLSVKALTRLRHHSGQGDEKNIALMLDGRFTLKTVDLGLKAIPAAALIEVRFTLTAYPPQAAAAK